MSLEITELMTPEEVAESFAVMQQLRGHVKEEGYPKILEEMRNDGYRLFAAREDGRIVALAGVGFGTNFYYGRYLWVYDLITSETERSKGHGLALLSHMEELARSEGCHTIALSSALHRVDAHRFYEEKAGFERVSYAFAKSLTEPKG
jgi:GNAT superfamily N-acetyltransferase